MIDLGRSRAGLLAEIEAPLARGRALSDITDPRVATASGRVRVHGRGREDLFPLLKAALLERFSAVPRPELIRDLLVPVKSALGNASKHGNGADPTKVIAVELELARKGVLIAITDQGNGFDAALKFRRFQNKESYATNHGRGLLHLHRARSAVSYENAGRTVLLCFQPTMETRSSDPPGEGTARIRPPEAGGERIRDGLREHPVTPALDADWVQAHLPAAAPEFNRTHAQIEACRVYAPRGSACDDCGIRYLLRVSSRDGRRSAMRILTGRLHPTASAAAADFESAARLCAARLQSAQAEARLLVPRPVAWFAEEPRLILYDFDPWLNLREYLAHRRSLKSARHAAERAGETLALLHRSRVLRRSSHSEAPGAKVHAMIGRCETKLRSLKGEPELVNRFRACAQALRKQITFRAPRTLASIHGAFGWDCIQYGVEGRFYLYRFESCGWSDPGIDLGGFAAELLRFTRTHHDEGGYRVCRDALLGAYNQEAQQPMTAEELRFYIDYALIERLQRMPLRATAEAGDWLAALETDVWGRWQAPPKPSVWG